MQNAELVLHKFKIGGDEITFCAMRGDKFVAYLGVCEKFGDRRTRAKKLLELCLQILYFVASFIRAVMRNAARATPA